MNTEAVVILLASLAHPTRLDIFRKLVVAGEEGIAAGAIASEIGIPASSLSFHLKELSHAGMVRSRQSGRFVVYTADYDTMSELIEFLSANCCEGRPCAVVALPKLRKRPPARIAKTVARRA